MEGFSNQLEVPSRHNDPTYNSKRIFIRDYTGTIDLEIRFLLTANGHFPYTFEYRFRSGANTFMNVDVTLSSSIPHTSIVKLLIFIILDASVDLKDNFI